MFPNGDPKNLNPCFVEASLHFGRERVYLKLDEAAALSFLIFIKNPQKPVSLVR